MRLIIILALIIPLSACDELLSNCIDFDGPELNSGPVPVATLNEEYVATIGASIDNNPNDDYYQYEITLSGNLPDGISVYRDGNDRTIQLIGTPTELGSYEFTLKVKATEPSSYSYEEDTDGLCYNTDENKYVLTVSI